MWLFGLAVLAVVSGDDAPSSPLEVGFAGAVRGCEEWVLNPASWIDGTKPFLTTVGLGDRMGLVASVSPMSLPPEELRVGNLHWRINATDDAGYVFVVSEQLPMCHITGGGGADLRNAIEATLGSEPFMSRWVEVGTNRDGDLVSTTYRHRDEEAFSMVVTRANADGASLNRVQVVATAMIGLAD